jgi:hypothetical protein
LKRYIHCSVKSPVIISKKKICNLIS